MPMLHLLPAMLLLSSVVLKVYQLVLLPSFGDSLLDGPVATALLIEVEIAMAFWLISCWKPSVLRIAAISLFFLFLVWNIERVMNAETTCGCFGALRVPPQISLALNVAMILAIILWQPKPLAATRLKLVKRAWIATALLVLVPLIGTLNHSVEEFVLGKQDREFIILRPNSWIGNRFPLIKYLDRELPIESGNWQIVLFHPECPQSQLILNSILNDTQIRTLLLELPSDASSVKEDANNIFWAKLKNDSKWFVSTPVFITIKDGIVTSCANDKNLFGQETNSPNQGDAE